MFSSSFYLFKDYIVCNEGLFDKKRNLYCITKNAIKVSPFSCDTGCFHRTDDITNANSYVGYSLILDLIIYRKGEGCQDSFCIFV